MVRQARSRSARSRDLGPETGDRRPGPRATDLRSRQRLRGFAVPMVGLLEQADTRMPAVPPAEPVGGAFRRESDDWLRADGLVVRFRAEVAPVAQEQILQAMEATVRARLI